MWTWYALCVRLPKPNQQSTILRSDLEMKPFSRVLVALWALSRRVLGPKLLNPPLDCLSVCGHWVR